MKNEFHDFDKTIFDDVGALQSSFKKAPGIFESVGVNLSVNIPFGMVHDLMLESIRIAAKGLAALASLVV